MGLIVGMVNLKGGVGKSTLAVNIASAWDRRGEHVLVVDCDPQGSALDWAAARADPPLFSVLGLPRPSVRKELPLISDGYDRVIIDAPARVGDINRAVIMASDVVVIPALPSPYDVRALEEMAQLIDEARQFKDSLKACFVVNRLILGTVIGRDIYEGLAAYGLPVLKTSVTQRVIFAEAGVTGQALWEMPASRSRASAIEEITQLVDEIAEFARAKENRV